MDRKLNKLTIFVLILILPTMVFSQFYAYYYGKNKVIKNSFNWKYFDTPNFRVYHYTDDMKLLKKIAVTAENGYDKMSKYLNVEIEKRIPLIFYRTHVDFEQTNIYPGFLPPGVEAFAEPLTNRMVLHGDSSAEDLMRTLTHELGHVFEYQVLYKKSSKSLFRFRPPPLWVMEGFSEFITRDWDPFSLLTIRDAVLNGRIPALTRHGQLVIANQTGRSAYDFGHIVYEFIEAKYGVRGVRNLLFSFRGNIYGSGRNIFRQWGTTYKEFNFELRKYVKDRFRDFVTKESAEDYGYIIGPNSPFAYSFSHQVSPGGELAATVTANFKSRKIDIILISMKDGKIVKTLTPGLTSKHDGISVLFNPADGSSFTWDKEGDRIAFFARKEYTSYMVIIDVLESKIVKMIDLNGIMEPSSPNFTNDGKNIYFAGVDGSKSFIYRHDLLTGKTDRVTRGFLYVKSLDLSPDGKRVAFSATQGKYSHIYIGNINNPELAMKITSGNTNNITPSFSSDGKKIYFSSDEKGAYNLYSTNLEEKINYRYTDVQTAVFFPMEIPGEEEKLLVSSYLKGTFVLLKKDISEYSEKRDVQFENPKLVKGENGKEEIRFSKEVIEKYGKENIHGTKFSLIDGEIKANRSFNKELEEDLNFNLANRKKYKPFKSLSVPTLPPITAGFGSDGSIFGFSFLQLTDVLNDHSFSLLISSYYGYRSYGLTYVNLKNRLQFFSRLYWYSNSYFLGGAGYIDPTSTAYLDKRNYTLVSQRIGLTTGFYYPFSRSYRAEFSLSIHHQKELTDELLYGTELPYNQTFDGYALPVTLSLVGETTRFTNFGPLTGHTFKISFSKYFKLSNDFLDSTAIDVDLRKYFKLAPNTLIAMRFTGFTSSGANPMLFATGGNNTLRASNFRSLVGTNGFAFVTELRFPLIKYMATPIGILGPVRGVLFFDLGGVWDDSIPPYTGPDPYWKNYYDELRTFDMFSDGIELKDALSSYGFALEVNLWGYPLHFEWIYKTNLKEARFYGMKFWIGFNF
ncbi:MAG: hypothetical protein ABFR36_06670 [Acidobacteriota bacterium]